MVASGRSTRRSVSPGWPFCPPVFLPDGARRLLTRRGLFSPSLDGGLPLLLLFSPRRRSSSAMRASCANSRAMSASFESWLSASRSTNSLESANRSHVKQNLDRTTVTPVNRRNSARKPEPPATWAVTFNDLFALDADVSRPGISYDELCELAVTRGNISRNDLAPLQTWRAEMIGRQDKVPFAWELSDGRTFMVTHQPMEDGWLTTYERWLASSRQCFALDKWILCRLTL